MRPNCKWPFVPVEGIWNYSCGQQLGVERFLKQAINSVLFLGGKCTGSLMEVGRGCRKAGGREDREDAPAEQITCSSWLTSFAIYGMKSELYLHIHSGLIISRQRGVERLPRSHNGNKPNL